MRENNGYKITHAERKLAGVCLECGQESGSNLVRVNNMSPHGYITSVHVEGCDMCYWKYDGFIRTVFRFPNGETRDKRL